MKKLPSFIRKIYVLCSAESIDECRACPFFKLPEDRFFCGDDPEDLIEEIESDIEEVEDDDES